MERVAFLIEETNERLSCLLNPEHVIIQRIGGVQTRRNAGGKLTGNGLADDPLLYTGGGRTELELDLLFDIELIGSSVETVDVRDLTAPLWNLTENITSRDEQRRRVPRIRLIWGKHWNIPGVIVSASERLGDFTSDGLPRRSWLRLRMIRIADEPPQVLKTPEQRAREVSLSQFSNEELVDQLQQNIDDELTLFHEVIGDERLDELAERYYEDSQYWRLLASVNGIIDPNNLIVGSVLVIPSAPAYVSRLVTYIDRIPQTAQSVFSTMRQYMATTNLRSDI